MSVTVLRALPVAPTTNGAARRETDTVSATRTTIIMHKLTSAMRDELVDIARAAGDAILTVYASDFDVMSKSDQTPVTAADVAAHELIAARLHKLAPDIPLLSEEGSIAPYTARRGWPRYWLIDPLDGTREFVSRNGEFTVNIALIEGSQAVLGVVHVPVTGTTYSGGAAIGSFQRDGTAPEVRVGAATTSRTPIRVLASRSHRDAHVDDWLAGLPEANVIACGSSVKFCRIATGEADVYPRFGPTCEWDTAAAQAVAEGAGARVVTLDGAPLAYNTKESLLNPHFIVAGPADHDWLANIPSAAQR